MGVVPETAAARNDDGTLCPDAVVIVERPVVAIVSGIIRTGSMMAGLNEGEGRWASQFFENGKRVGDFQLGSISR